VKINNRQQLLVIVAIAATVLLFADRAVFAPLLGVWKTRATQITELRNQVTHGTTVLKDEQSIRRRWDAMRRNALPPDPSFAEAQVLRSFDNWARSSRENITMITPQWKREDDYLSLECRVDASGDLSTLARFLYEIERDPVAVKLESVELTAHDAAGQQMTLALQASGLVLIPATR
jgi:hypothetical protein